MGHSTRRRYGTAHGHTAAREAATWAMPFFAATIVAATLLALAAQPAAAAVTPPTVVPPGASSALTSALFGGTTPSLPNPGSLFTTLAADAATIQSYISGYATALFIGLVGIDVAWTIAQALLGRGDVGELVVTIVQKVITFNIVYWVFVVNGYGIVTTIVSSFYTLGNNVLPSIQGPIPAPTDPLGLIGLGIGVASPMLVEATVLGAIPDEVLGNGATNLMTGLIDINLVGAVLTVGAYAFLAGTLALAVVEAYIVTSAGIIVTGFMGSRWTVSIGEKYFSYAMSVGVKLLMVYICIGLINPLAGIIAGFSLIPVVGPIFAAFIALVAAMIAFSAPQFAASLVSGSSNSSFGTFLGTALGAASAATGLGATLGGIGARTGKTLGGSAGTAGTSAATDGATAPAQTLGANDPLALDTANAQQTPGDVFDGPLSERSASANRTPDGSATENPGFADPFDKDSTLANVRFADLDGAQSVARANADFDGTATRASRSASAEIPEPATLEPGAYRSMSASDLGRNVNAKTVAQMSRAQLRDVRGHDAFAGLRSDQRELVESALLDKRLESANRVHDAIGGAAEAFAKAIPAHDRGETGAVSIRVNV